MLYDGFFDRSDKTKIAKVRSTPSKELKKIDFKFKDPRLPELLFRYRARNFPSTLSKTEQARWKKYCQNRWNSEDGGGSFTVAKFYEEIETRLDDKDLTREKVEILKQLKSYAKDKTSI